MAGAATGPATASAAGTRVTIAVFGDSVAEGYTVPHFERTSLVPQLRDGLAQRGFARGGSGFVPAMPFRWDFSRYVVQGQRPAAADWQLWGLGGLHGQDGPSGYSAIATAPLARARRTVTDPQAGLLYVTTRESSPFVVKAGAQEWRLDAAAPGAPYPTQTWLDLPPGTRSVTVYGPRSGRLTLTGLIGRRPVPDSGIQVEVSNLGHAGHAPNWDLTHRVLQAVGDQRYDISLLLWSYIFELGVKAKRVPGDAGDYYELILLRRAKIARASGGACLIADSSPMPVPFPVRRRFWRMQARVARKAGCQHTNVLAHLWSVRTARRKGLVQEDDIHPTPAGYRLMAKALAPVLARMVRQRAGAP